MRPRKKTGPTRTLAQLTDSVEWKTGFPTKSDYYLIAWVNTSLAEAWYNLPEHVNVSEAWFNPDSIFPWWWSRGYTGEPRRGINAAIQHEVIAWMPMPNPPEIVKKQR